MNFGINLSFAVKRWPEPDVWARMVREDLGLQTVQFTFDLLDPFSPSPEREVLSEAIRRAAHERDVEIHSAFVGLSAYTYNGLLHPDPAGRRVAMEWWRRAIDVAARIGAKAVGGPLGGASVSAAKRSGWQEREYDALLGALEDLSRAASEAGLEQLMIEPTPLVREIPHDTEQARRLLDDLGGRITLPIRYVIDVGHALYRPLYGAHADLDRWFDLKEKVGMIHLQNTDFQSDSHWGWPDERGAVDVAAFGEKVRTAGLEDVPVILEVFYPFEADDEEVLANVKSSVAHCKRELGLPTDEEPTETGEPKK